MAQQVAQKQVCPQARPVSTLHVPGPSDWFRVMPMIQSVQWVSVRNVLELWGLHHLFYPTGPGIESMSPWNFQRLPCGQETSMKGRKRDSLGYQLFFRTQPHLHLDGLYKHSIYYISYFSLTQPKGVCALKDSPYSTSSVHTFTCYQQEVLILIQMLPEAGIVRKARVRPERSSGQELLEDPQVLQKSPK